MAYLNEVVEWLLDKHNVEVLLATV